MADIQTVRTEVDYEAALARIDQLMDAEPGSPEGRELDMLVDLVRSVRAPARADGVSRSRGRHRVPHGAGGLGPRDLIPFIGSRAKVSEVLSGRRAITTPMARALHEHLGIPADVLLRSPDDSRARPLARPDRPRRPLR